MKNLVAIFGVVLFVVFFSQFALAKDLVDAAVSAQAIFTKIGVAAVSIGITLGGILFAVGMGQIGRMIVISGLIGAFFILAGPAIIQLLGRVFGVSL